MIQLRVMKLWKMSLLVLSGLGLYSVANTSAEIGNVHQRKKIFKKNSRFWVIAHRGFSGRFPENTMLSFQEAARLPIDAIELDVHSTREGKIVVIHDPTLDRTTNKTGRVFDHSWEDLRRADAGYYFDPTGEKHYPFRNKNVTVPLLEDVFKTLPEMKFIIEIKQTLPAIEDSVYRLIRKYRMDEKVIVASEHLEPLARIRYVGDHISTNLSREEAKDFYHAFKLRLSSFYRGQGDALQIPERYHLRQVVTSEFVKAVHRKGLIIHIWTVNDPADMKRLIHCGVDGIISDYPDRLLQVVGRVPTAALQPQVS